MHCVNRRALMFGLVLALMVSLFAAPLGALAEAVEVDVKAAVKAVKPTSVELDVMGTVELQPGQTLQLAATVYPEDATNKKVTFTSSKKSVAKVSKNGKVTALKPGTAKITVKTKLAGKKATVTVKVAYKYRFYGIANGSYKNKKIQNLKNYKNDLSSMNSIYGAARFEGGKVKRSYKKNLTSSGIKNYLKKIANSKSIQSDDVTIIYYSGHGADSSFGAGYAGAWVGTNATGRGTTGLVSVDTVQYYLDQIPGDVVVIIDSCLSGQFIETKGLRSAAMARAEAALYNQSVVNAFARSNKAKSVSRADSGLTAKTLTSGQYHVITACAPLEVSYAADFNRLLGIPIGYRSFLTAYIQDGTVGFKKINGAPLAADRDGDNRISISELYQHAAGPIASITASAAEGPSNVMIYPEGDAFPVFAIN